MIIKGTFELKPILHLMDTGATSLMIRGITASLTSSRLKLFHTKGTTCVLCGLKATCFKLQKIAGSKTYHLGMYADEIMFTQDHIVAQCLGGSNDMDNLQVMCAPCNNKKSVVENALYKIHEMPLDFVQTLLAASMVRVAVLTPKVDPITYSNQLNEQLLYAWQGV